MSGAKEISLPGSTLRSSPAASPNGTQPFGYEASEPVFNRFAGRWRIAKLMIDAEQNVIEQCRAEIESCSAAAALFVDIVDKAMLRETRARIGEINRAINQTLRYTDDTALYGGGDVWASPLTALAARRGDCEDYAIAKYAALRAAGFAEEDLRLVIARNNEAGEGHMVVAVRHDGRWLVLDNLRNTVEDAVAMSRLTPRFFLAGETVREALAPAAAPDMPQLALASLEVAPLL